MRMEVRMEMTMLLIQHSAHFLLPPILRNSLETLLGESIIIKPSLS